MPEVDRVIVGASGSPGSLRALRYARVLARAHEAALLPVIAWTPPGGDRGGRCQPGVYLRQVWQEVAVQRLRDALAAAWGEIPGDLRVEPHVERGPAGWVLVSLACHPGDVLVLGAGRRGALARMACCEVSRYCAAHAQCPVLLIPPPVLARAWGRGRLARVFWHCNLTRAGVFGERSRPAAAG